MRNRKCDICGKGDRDGMEGTNICPTTVYSLVVSEEVEDLNVPSILNTIEDSVNWW